MTPTERAKWLEERKNGVGASEIAAVCGIHPYETPRSIWMQKKGTLVVEENTAMRHGLFVEDFIASEFAELVDIDVSELKMVDTVKHAQFPFMFASPDRLWTQGGEVTVVELKAVGEFAAQNFGAAGTDQVPDHYLLQVGWQMFILGAKKGYLVALIGNREIRPFQFEWNDAMQAVVARAVEECIIFWRDYVEADMPPPLIGHKKDKQIVGSEYPDNDDYTVLPSDKHIEALVDGWNDLRKSMLTIDTEIERRKNLVREMIGACDGIESSVGTFTNKADKNKRRNLRTPFRSNIA